MAEKQENPWMTATEARARLGVSKTIMARWLRDGTLHFETSPYNKLVKLVLRADVEELAKLPRVQRKEAPAA